MPAFHRLDEKSSTDVFERYKKRLLKAVDIKQVRAVVVCVEKNAKLNYQDIVKIETLAAHRKDALTRPQTAKKHVYFDVREKKIPMPCKKGKVQRNDILRLTNCPKGSVSYVAEKMGFESTGEIINGKYTLFYDKKILTAISKIYGKRDGENDK